MMRKTMLAALAMTAGAASAQDYFDFSQIPGVPEAPKVQVDLNSMMLDFVRQAAQAADPTAAEALAGIEGVRVLVYDIGDNTDQLFEYIDGASSELEGDGWQRMAYVQDEAARVRVYVQFAEQKMSGLTVMAADMNGNEAVFINLLGEIDPAQLGRVAGALGVEHGVMPALGGAATAPESAGNE